jgi:hypothetical protein
LPLNDVGLGVGARPPEGYIKIVSFIDPTTVDAAGRGVQIDPGDVRYRGVRVVQVNAEGARGADGSLIDTPGELGEGQMSFDRQVRYLLEMQLEVMRRMLQRFEILLMHSIPDAATMMATSFPYHHDMHDQGLMDEPFTTITDR